METERAAVLAVDQVRRLLPPDSDVDPRSENGVAEAVANLQRFALVGILEDLDRFADGYAARFGLRPSFGQRNTGAARQRAPIPDELRRRVVDLCAPSRRLYDEARTLSG